MSTRAPTRPGPRPASPPTTREVLDLALTLHEDEARGRERDADHRASEAALREAAAELGVDQRHVDRALVELARRREEDAARRARRSRIGRSLGLGLVAALAATGLAWVVAAPADPWTTRFEQRERWTVATSPRTLALLRWAAPTGSDGHRDALVTLDHVADRTGDRDDDRWWVDLEGSELPDFGGHDALVLTVWGNLPRARLTLWSGPDERWVAPAITLRPSPTEQRVPFAALDHQRLERGRWRSVDDVFGDRPSDIDRLVVSLGDGVNPRDARGYVRLGELRCE